MSIRVILLYGRPGVGKLTVGELLADETGYRLLHNHAVVDRVTSQFEFGSPAFVALREKLWLDAVEGAISASLDGLIMTFAPEATVTEEFIPTLTSLVRARGGTVHFIELQCSDAEVDARITAESRQKFGKLHDVDTYRKLEAAGAFDRPRMPAPELVVDTTIQKPIESARIIAKHLQPLRVGQTL